MKKYLKDFKVSGITRFDNATALVELTPCDGILPPALPGQFVNIKVDGCGDVFLRRPISICDIDEESSTLYLYIKKAGKGTEALIEARSGDIWNLLLPLGNGFRTEGAALPRRPLLIGGGVGMAPMLYLGRVLARKGVRPSFLLGGATAGDIPLLGLFEKTADTFVTTADGSAGVKGFVTDHPAVSDFAFDCFYCCGPTPMMKAVGALARQKGTDCYVSLENRMACGLGACLCCVEDTAEGHKCVCTDGPVFNINNLKW